MTKAEVRTALYRELAPLCPGWTLVKKENAFVRTIPGGAQKVLVSLVDYNPKFRFALVFATRLEKVEAIANRFSGATPKTTSITLTTMTQLSYFFPGTQDKELSVTTEAEIIAAIRALAPMIRERALPLMDARRSVAALDVALNGGDPTFDTSDRTSRTLRALTLARLAGNPRFEELAATYENGLRAYPSLSRTKVSRLLAYLRSPDFTTSTKDSP
jgi:hypothetical protein